VNTIERSHQVLAVIKLHMNLFQTDSSTDTLI
jgi:hypothetical protein